MGDVFGFIDSYRLLTVILACGSIAPAILVVRRISALGGWRMAEARGTRGEKSSLYTRCSLLVSQAIRDYEKRKKKAGIYARSCSKLRKAGYNGQYAPAVYLLLKYIAVPLFLAASTTANYPDVARPAAASLLLIVVIELTIARNRRNINLKLQKYIYKIYKYLHNQVSSGIKVTDAIKSVYEVIDDKELRGLLVRLAARYELTLDIDAALEEFKSGFAVHEAETLCVALKQGIETGDNQELLARQEDVMFKKYFNYIQAETDSCKTRSLMAAVMFTAIVVIMIVVPLIKDTAKALGMIFVN